MTETSGESFLENIDKYKFKRYTGGSKIPAVLVKGASWKQYYCKFCGKKVPKGCGRRYYCTNECSIEMNIRGGFWQLAVHRKCDWKCVTCGEEWKSPKPWEKKNLEVDHIIPVVEGGGSCGIDNLRLLCSKCHKGETKALAKRRKEQRGLKKA